MAKVTNCKLEKLFWAMGIDSPLRSCLDSEWPTEASIPVRTQASKLDLDGL